MEVNDPFGYEYIEIPDQSLEALEHYVDYMVLRELLYRYFPACNLEYFQ